MPHERRVAVVLALLIAVASAGVATAQVTEVPAGAADAVGRTPPRLGLVDGQVSFWRPGAEQWVAAQLNTALAPGDELYTGSPGNLEFQIGARAYVRAWAATQLGITSLEPSFVQLKITTGHVGLDVRRLAPGQTVEVDTPNAAFTIEQAGYYRLKVTEGRTSFITRRAGRATVTSANGTAAAVAPSEEVVVEGADGARVSTYVAPELDVWDRWNYARTDALIDSLSSRYVSSDIYGVDDLDHHGSWRVVDPYGPVWVPPVPADWAPYSTGSWMWDPYHAWTWVDAAPWGWAPYHHGRWVHLGNVWAWAPGPPVTTPVYAPALVAFLGPRVGSSISIAGPAVGWVALGWGEPIIPWWGPAGFIGVPRWDGWGGPRVVNGVAIGRTTVVDVREITVYRHVEVRRAVTVISRDRFGRGPVPGTRVTVDPRQLAPVHGKLDVAPARASLVPGLNRGVRPPEAALRRPVVATRPPQDPARWLGPHGIPGPATTPAPSPRLVPAPPRGAGAEAISRPPFGASKIERPRSTPPPRPDRSRLPAASPQAPAARSRALPGEPANRLFPGSSSRTPARAAQPGVRAPGARPPASTRAPGR
jgi:hypothetical protein